MAIDKVYGMSRVVDVTITRPADTNAYTAGDVITGSTSAGTYATVAGLLGPNGRTIINEVICIDSVAAGTKPDLEIWLFDTAPAAQNDNTAFAPSDAEALRVQAIIPVSVSDFKATSNNAVCVAKNLGSAVQGPMTAATQLQQDLYMYLVVRNAYTPSSAETFTFRFKCLD